MSPGGVFTLDASCWGDVFPPDFIMNTFHTQMLSIRVLCRPWYSVGMQIGTIAKVILALAHVIRLVGWLKHVKPLSLSLSCCDSRTWWNYPLWRLSVSVGCYACCIVLESLWHLQIVNIHVVSRL